jgi:hypothetical protein
MEKSDRLIDVLTVEVTETLCDVLPRRLGKTMSQADWESIQAEVVAQFMARAKNNHLISEILTEGDLKTLKQRVNIRGFIKAIEEEAATQPPGEQQKLTHMLSFLKRAVDNIDIFKKRR